MLILTSTLLLLVILPWKNYKNITYIIVTNQEKLRKLTNFLIIVNSFAFIILLITTIIVQTTIKDINQFKYGDGVSLEFYSTMLPFSSSFLSLANIIDSFAYFMLPLHFYYLSNKKNKLAYLCLLLSFNIMLKGTIYFSRYVIIEYTFLYFALFLILNKTLPRTTVRALKRTAIVGLLFFLIYFTNISINRFSEDSSAATNYEIPSSSLLKTPIIYSFVDYFSQWYYHGIEVLHDYDFKTFKFKTTLKSLNSLLEGLGIGLYSSIDYRNLRMLLWKDNWYTFTGFPAYAIYDYGIIGAIFFCIIYSFVVYKKRPISRKILISNIFLICLLIQIPIMSIFYSQMESLLIPLIYYFIIKFYMRVRIKTELSSTQVPDYASYD